MHKIDLNKVFKEFKESNNLDFLMSNLTEYILLNKGLEYLVDSYMNTVVIKSGSLSMFITKKAIDKKINVLIADRLEKNVVKEILGLLDTHVIGMSFFKVDKVILPITTNKNQLTHLLSSDIDGEQIHCFIHGIYCIIPTYKNLIIIKID